MFLSLSSLIFLFLSPLSLIILFSFSLYPLFVCFSLSLPFVLSHFIYSLIYHFFLYIFNHKSASFSFSLHPLFVSLSLSLFIFLFLSFLDHFIISLFLSHTQTLSLTLSIFRLLYFFYFLSLLIKQFLFLSLSSPCLFLSLFVNILCLQSCHFSLRENFKNFMATL